MTEINKIQNVSDGDQLNEGYFNGHINMHSSNIILLILNQDEIGTPVYSYNYEYHTLFSATTDVASNTMIRTAGTFYVPSLGIGDSFDDAVVGDYTDSGTVTTTETGGSMFITSGAGTNSNGYTIMDNDMFTTVNYIEAKVRLAVDYNTRTASLYISDGTNEVLVKTVNTVVGADTTAYRFHKVDSNSIEWWDDGAAQSDLDTSGLVASTDRYLKFYVATSSGGRADENVYYIFECNSSWNYLYYSSNVITNSLETITTSEDHSIIVVGYDNTIPTIECSFNAGSNYTTLTNSEWKIIGNTGTSVVLRLSYSNGTFTYTDIDTTTLPKLKAVGGLYK